MAGSSLAPSFPTASPIGPTRDPESASGRFRNSRATRRIRQSSALEARPGQPMKLTRIERFAFYERAKEAFAAISTGEALFYGNIIIRKGTAKGPCRRDLAIFTVNRWSGRTCRSLFPTRGVDELQRPLLVAAP
ncbi:RbsD/FucU domain-containing protein [Rhizobium sp. BK313]|uniref:RbsD/FucU domain-containing protein n=1 Tax=Rhizobium sp. BK313 TaxID=2587081 RepID=UPI001060D7F5|nr:RbsD/FucU domain-containing protein [Rhizobium sp. BK313]